MNTRFGSSGLSLRTGVRRDQLLFCAAAGLSLSLLIILLLVANHGSSDSEKIEKLEDLSPVGTVNLLAADRIIHLGDKVPLEAFRQIYWPRNQVPPGAVFDMSELENKFAKVEIQPFKPVQREQFSDESVSDNPFVGLRAGMRAITIEVDIKGMVEGFVRPGIWVDVNVTYSDGTSEILIPKVKVLSFLGRLKEDRIEIGRAPRVMPHVATVTLEVTPKDGLRINSASTLGKLSLMLRPTGDDGTPEVGTVKPREKPEAKPIEPFHESSCGKLRVGHEAYDVECKSGELIHHMPTE